MKNGSGDDLAANDLIARIIEGDMRAVDLFVEKWQDFVRKSIINTLRNRNMLKTAWDFDEVDRLTVEVLLKLLSPKTLSKLDREGAIGAYVWTAARNRALDHVRRKSRKSGMWNRFVSKTAESLDDPVESPRYDAGGGRKTTKLDLTSAPAPASKAKRTEFERIMCVLESEFDPIDYWIVRLDIVHLLALEEEEFREICRLFDHRPELVRETVSEMLEAVGKKIEKAEKAEKRAADLFCETKRLRDLVLRSAENDGESSEAVEKLRKELCKKEKLLRKKIADSRKSAEPPRKLIGKLLNIDSNLVSVRLKRLRERLESMREDEKGENGPDDSEQ